MINSLFEFHPVGQGAFYTGRITCNSAEFTIVYDCGSSSGSEGLRSEINYFKHTTRGAEMKKLDVLFISHLDDDHVNGLKVLLSGLTCENVYLPYLTPRQRFYLALRHSPSDTLDYEDYLRFLVSPHNYLNNIENCEIRRINYVVGNAGFDEQINEQIKEPINPDNFEFFIQDFLQYSDGENAEEESENLPSNVFFKTANNKLIIPRMWEFFLFHEPAEEPIFKDFEDQFCSIFLKGRFDMITPSDLKELFDEHEKLKLIRKLYKSKFKSLNKTGLLVMHQPIGYNRLVFNDYHLQHFSRDRYLIFDSPFSHLRTVINDSDDYSFGFTLLTGDISLNQIKNSKYIAKKLKNVVVFQVPHHGSSTGWNNEYLKELSTSDTTNGVINFGFGNKFGHPKPIVLKDLLRWGFPVRFNNQFETYRYHFQLELK